MKFCLLIICFLVIIYACTNKEKFESSNDKVLKVNIKESGANKIDSVSVGEILQIIKEDSISLQNAMQAGIIDFTLAEEDIIYNQDSTLLFTNEKYNIKATPLYGLPYLGIDHYRCNYNDSELRIALSFGFNSGKTLYISVLGDSVFTKLVSYGCGFEDNIQYKTTSQKLSFKNIDFNSADSIIGHIHFEAVPDARHFCELILEKEFRSNWIKTILSQKVIIKGFFRLNKLIDFFESSNEYSRVKLFEQNRTNQVSKTMDSIRMGLINTIDAKWAGLTDIPTGMNELQGLENLNFHFNRFEKDVFEDLNDLQNLTYLNLSSNRLKAFPLSLLDIKSLKYLNISNNKITYYPAIEIAKSNIESIRLDNGKLTPGQRMLLEDKLVIPK